MIKCWKSFIFVVACAFVAVNGFRDCGSTNGTVENVIIPGCDNPDARCILHRNTNASVTIEFTSKEGSESLEAVVHGIVLGVEVPFALPNPNACKDCGLNCPIKEGEKYSYSTTLPVLKKYPKVTVDIKWELKDGNGNDVICVLIPAKVQ